MPGPKSRPLGGKTKKDHNSGKWQRRLINRHKDPVRESGGKESIYAILAGRSR